MTKIYNVRSEKLPAKLKQMRKESDLTLQEVSDELGCAPQTVLRYENGTRGISFAKLEELTKVYKVSAMVSLKEVA